MIELDLSNRNVQGFWEPSFSFSEISSNHTKYRKTSLMKASYIMNIDVLSYRYLIVRKVLTEHMLKTGATWLHV